jgi:hypothetical protein
MHPLVPSALLTPRAAATPGREASRGARSAAGVVLAALLLAPAAAAVVRSSTSGPALTGDATGLQLVRQVNRSYKNVPAARIQITGQGGTLAIQFTVILRDGVAIATQALVTAAGEKGILVRRENEGTFSRDPNSSCWRFLPPNDPQALTGVGKPILSGPGRVSKPRVAGDTITMTLTASTGQTSRVVVDRKTSRLRRMNGAPDYLARYTSLAKRPTLAVPKPRC